MVRDAVRRWVALALLLLSPGVMGQVVPLLHPCPAEHAAAPQAGGMAGMSHGGGGHHHDAPVRDDGHTACTCLGACHTPALLTPPDIRIADVATVDQPTASGLLSATTFMASPRPIDRLPPQTAPPLV